MVLQLHSSVTLRPKSVHHHVHHVDNQGQRLRNKKNKQRKVLLICSFATLVFFVVLASDVIKSHNLQRRLSCQMRRMKHQEQQQHAGSGSLEDYHEYNYDNLQYGNSFAKIVERMITRRMGEAGTITTECETTFPNDIATIAGDAYYADTPEVDYGGSYYPEDALIESGNDDPENFDPSILVPDVNDHASYSLVIVALLKAYKPKVYVPTETDGDNTSSGATPSTGTNTQDGTNSDNGENTANDPDDEVDLPHQDTIAYTVIITTCPLEAQAPESEVTDPGVDVYEVTAMTKEFVCNATDTAGLKVGLTVGEGTFTM